ncbi:DUF624 domain-containing protein [Vibrio sp. 10N.286.51.F4]|uniref:DUF624 domain-containing protein n=1 Tax=Vibrio sp. 10N.286.51.F4 TaxID=3229710 RepID=UPI0035527082
MTSTSPLIIACQWISRLAWLNLIWVMLVICGAGLFGIVPASVVVCTLLRRLLNGNNVRTSEVWEEYKSVFFRANQLLIIVCLPLFSIGWYLHWTIVNGSNIVSVVSLAFAPALVIASVWLFCCIIQMSIYHSESIKDDLKNGLSLLFTEKKLVMICMVLLLCLLGVALTMPVLALIFGLTPIFTCAVAWLWHNKEELNTLQM